MVAAIYVFGGLVLYLRLQIKDVRTDAVIGSLPREFLVAVGLGVLAQFLFALLFLLGGFVQQVEPSTRIGGSHPKLAVVIRGALVLGATMCLAVPLSRWIEFGWPALVILLVEGTFGLLSVVLYVQKVPWPRGEAYRWAVALGAFGIAALGVGLFATGGRDDKTVELAVVISAAILTAASFWLLLQKFADPFWSDYRRRKPMVFFRGASLVALVAFIVFIPWRVALEWASIDSLDALVCTSHSSQSIDGLFIGANDSRVYVGENSKDFHRVAEVPRTEIRRIYVGKNAETVACPATLDSLTVRPASVRAGDKATASARLTNRAPIQHPVWITVSTSRPGVVEVITPRRQVPRQKAKVRFSLQAKRVSRALQVNVTASSGGVVKTALLTVAP